MNRLTVMLVFAAALGGCGFKAASGGVSVTGAAGSAGHGSGGVGGSGGVSHGTGGIGLSPGTGGFTTIGTGGDVGISGAAGTNCGQTNLNIMTLPPDILIVQDRSLSMTDNTMDKACDGGSVSGDGKCGAASKWSQTITALNAVLKQTETTVNWGLYWLGDEAAQCGVSATPAVQIEPAGYNDISLQFMNNTFAGQPGTPTAAVMKNALTYMQTLTDPNPKYILLATDGEPNCPNGSATLNTNDATGAQQAVATALTAGFPTFVVGIATTTDTGATNALNAMAVAGGEPQLNAATQYYAVTDTASLVTALGAILKLATPCTVPLTGAPPDLSNVAISAQDMSGNRVEIMPDPVNGWTFDATKTHITLNGTSCSDLQNGIFINFQFIYACAGVTICIDSCPGT
jgi:hypothetical protein